MRTIVGLFETFADADKAVGGLYNLGFEKNEISVLARNDVIEVSRGEWIEPGDATATATGAAAGAAVGGLTGLILGLSAFAIPGLGLVISAGALGSALLTGLAGAGLGAAGGGLIGALVDVGIPKEEADFYAEGVKRGGVLVAVKTPDDRETEVTRVLSQSGAVDVASRLAEWRQSGFVNFDTDLPPDASYPTIRRPA